ncbi:Calcium/calmodulin-dependent 3',5'-cyclic nucleotide phosphodiesterase 1B [Phytophthora pseudosyringae]|uniref:Phosphodiesterase n=1 Tax=Phytophthora pseudosyringae TaxID=221518 RepID=A0A8T1VS90_9STRA|nr:Calcium/calmodulin-dependent 3',5'-cyclic nucleotide phosphodiesterase 1B [Phytophthora pseudosyringae]
MGNVFSTSSSSDTSRVQQQQQQQQQSSPVKKHKEKPHSLSDTTVSSSQASDYGDEPMQRTPGRRRRRESAASHDATLDTTGIRYANDDTHRRSGTATAPAIALVNGVLAWLMACAGGSPSATHGDDQPAYDERYLTEEKHRAFWELVQRILDLNDVVLMIRVLLDFLQDDLGAAAAAVFLVDQNSQNMSRITRGAPTQSGLAPSRGLVGEALNSRVARFLDDFNSEEGYDPEVDLAHEFAGQKLFCVPLMEHDSVYAIIEATTAHPTQRVMDELHVKLLTWLGPILSSCMRKCIEFHDVLLSERTQKALLHIISSSDTEDTVLNLVDGVIDGACHITKAERVTLFMIDWETEELWSLSSSYYDETLRVPLRASMLGLAATTQQTLNVRNPKTDRRFNWMTDQRRGIHTRCVLYVPVGIQESSQVIEGASSGSNRPIGVLEIINKVEEEIPAGITPDCSPGFTFDDECALEAFACEVAVILRRRSNEIEYIKLLADTRAEQVLAKRARSQVNLLECYTSYATTARAHPEACLRNSFVPSDRHVADCPECAAAAQLEAQAEQLNVTTHEVAKKKVSDHVHLADDVEKRIGKVVGNKNYNSGRLGYEFAGSNEKIPSVLLFSAPPGSRFPSWDFNVFTTDPAALPQLLEEMYLDFKVDEVLDTTKHCLQNFIVAMKEHYHPNPFHNFLHAFSVVHASYLLLSTTDAAYLLQPLDIAACLVASLGHDVDHPGHTNDFEVKSGSQLAMLYSDESVLEHHHAYTTFRLISKEKNANILQNLTAVDYRHFRKMVITAILGTDMANHFKFLEAIEKVLRPANHHVDTTAISSSKRDNSSVTGIIAASSGAKPMLDISPAKDQGKQGSEILNVLRDAVMQPEGSVAGTPRGSTSGSAPNSFHSTSGAKYTPGRAFSGRSTKGGWAYNGTVDERIFIVKTLVHASDLCGQVFPKPIALKWSNMISKEFAYQALMEQAENIPISYRNIDDPLKMVEGQLFFAQKIVSPLWDLMYIMFPDIDECMSNLRSNVAHYEQELQRLKDARIEEDLHADRMRQEHAELERQYEQDNPEQPNRRTRRDSMCGSEDEGVAVPGLARHNPAKFNSFRTIPEDDSNSNSEGVGAGSDGEPGVRASVLAAAEKSRMATRSRSSSISSNSSSDLDIDEQSLVVYE